MEAGLSSCTLHKALLVAAFVSVHAITTWCRFVLKSSHCNETSAHALLSRHNEVIIVVDIGSSSIRCSAFVTTDNDTDSRSRSCESEIPKHCNCHAVPGSIFRVKAESCEGSPGDVLTAVNKVVEDCICFLRDLGVKQIAKIGFASLAMSMVGVDTEGNGVTPVYTYASKDPKCNHANASSLSDFSEEGRWRHYRNTGTVLQHPSYASSHLRHISSEINHTKIHKWTTLCSYVIGRWTDIGSDCPVSYSEASWWGLLGLQAGLASSDIGWDDEAICRLGSQFSLNTLPDLCDFNEFYGKLSLAMASRWIELAGAHIFLAVGDGAAANIGSELIVSQDRCLDGTHVCPVGCITVGTSAAVRVIIQSSSYSSQGTKTTTDATEDRSESFRTPLWKYRVDKARILVGGALTDGGALVQWFSSCFGEDKLSQVMANFNDTVQAKQAESAWVESSEATEYMSKVPLTLPFWSGERSTGWHSAATGVLAGLCRQTTATDIYISMLEGIAFRIDSILDALRRERFINGNILSLMGESEKLDLDNIPVLATSGGVLEGTDSAFCQMLADVCGYTLAVSSSINAEDSVASGICVPRMNGLYDAFCNSFAGGSGELLPTFETTSLGVAALILSSGGLDVHIARNSDSRSYVVKKYVPRLHMHLFYRERFALHTDLYDAILNK